SDATTRDGVGVASVEEYLARAAPLKAAHVVLCAMGLGARDDAAQLTRLQAAGVGGPVAGLSGSDDAELGVTSMREGDDGLVPAGGGVRVVGMSDADGPELVMTMMDKGANGFMPADSALEVAAHALRLVAAGGQYFPAGSLLAARKLMVERQSSAPGARGMF